MAPGWCGGRVSGAARRDRCGGLLAATAGLRHRGDRRQSLALDVVVDDDLVETDFGAWEGLTFAEAAERDPELHRRWLQDTSITPPGGESFDDVLRRVRRGRDRIIVGYEARRCWWCHMSRRSKCCCGWRWMPGRASYIGCILIWHR